MYILLRFSTLFKSATFLSLGLRLIRFIDRFFSTLIRFSFSNKSREFAIAVGDTLRYFAISLWLILSPDLTHINENISLCNTVHFCLYISIMVYICKL